MTNKIIYNANYGGYSIPDKVRIKYNELANTSYESAWDMDAIPRHDKLLVQLVEEYIESHDSDLAVLEIDDNLYIINEYDGWETVVEPIDIDWICIE